MGQGVHAVFEFLVDLDERALLPVGGAQIPQAEHRTRHPRLEGGCANQQLTPGAIRPHQFQLALTGLAAGQRVDGETDTRRFGTKEQRRSGALDALPRTFEPRR